MEVTGLAELPVAKLATGFVSGTTDEILINEIEDYRRFYVEFEPHATEQDVVKAVGVVYNALARLSRK